LSASTYLTDPKTITALTEAENQLLKEYFLNFQEKVETTSLCHITSQDCSYFEDGLLGGGQMGEVVRGTITSLLPFSKFQRGL
jgi:hypothetical protein